MIANIFGPDLGIVVVIILLVVIFGSQLPKIARNVGTAGREFRRAQQEAEEEERDHARRTAAAASAAPAAAIPPPPAVGPAPSQPPPVAAPTREESVTLTRSELDALLRAREEQAKQGDSPSPGS